MPNVLISEEEPQNPEFRINVVNKFRFLKKLHASKINRICLSVCVHLCGLSVCPNLAVVTLVLIRVH